MKKGQLVSFELDWSAAHIEAARAVLAGTWEPSARWRGLGDGGFVKMTTASPDLPAEVAAEMAAAEAAIIDGSLQIFAGPLKDNSGAEKVAAGVTLTDDEVKGMNWLVEGVQGTLPSA